MAAPSTVPMAMGHDAGRPRPGVAPLLGSSEDSAEGATVTVTAVAASEVVSLESSLDVVLAVAEELSSAVEEVMVALLALMSPTLEHRLA